VGIAEDIAVGVRKKASRHQGTKASRKGKENREEFEKFTGSLDDLLEVPRGKEGERYTINYAALESPTIQIVIHDPGIRWPPIDPPKGVIMPGSSPNYLMFRPVLLNNGDSLPLILIQEEVLLTCIKLFW